MIEVVHVSSRGQIVIPQGVRKRMGIKSGARLVLLEKNDRIVLEKEEMIARSIADSQTESLGWMLLGYKGLKKIWDNPKDEKVWKEYL